MKSTIPTEEQIEFVLMMFRRIKSREPLDFKETLRFAGCLQLMAQAAGNGAWPNGEPK